MDPAAASDMMMRSIVISQHAQSSLRVDSQRAANLSAGSDAEPKGPSRRLRSLTLVRTPKGEASAGPERPRRGTKFGGGREVRVAPFCPRRLLF